jgi:EAL domain-containing protein (putative c-di-GMP-specific phosphodiesterase class I)
MPVDMLKIDKSFVDKMLTKESDRSFVDIIIKLGHLMGCKVIAEGVEDQSQLSALAFLGCDYVQGYVWGKPIPLDVLSNCL